MTQKILIFSSAIYDLYKQNILDNLAAPVGYLIHYRYARKYVQDELWAQVINQQESVVGLDGFTIFVNQYKKESPKHQHETEQSPDYGIRGNFPLRRIRVHSVELDGDVLHMYFVVNEYVDYLNVSEPAGETFQDHIESLLSGNHPPSKYIGLINAETILCPTSLGSRSQTNAWRRIVDVLSDMDEFQTAVFYRVVGLSHVIQTSWFEKLLAKIDLLFPDASLIYQQSIDHTNTVRRGSIKETPVEISEIWPKRSGYPLWGGETYSLQLTFHRKQGTTEKVEGARLTPDIDMSYFALRPSEIEVLFRYDKIDIDLIIKPLTQSTYSRIQILLDQENEKALKNAGRRSAGLAFASQLSFVIQFSAPRKYFWGFVIFFIGSLLTSFSPYVESPFRELFTIVGPSISAIVLFFLYRQFR